MAYPGISMVEEYLADNSRAGDPPIDSFSGAAGGSACGDLCRISIRPGEGYRVGEVSWAAEGCAAARAASAVVAEMVDGAPLLDAAKISPVDVERALGGLTEVSRHAATLAADALHRAISAVASSGARIAPDSPDRVAVAVSGGVDSAVAALLARERGLEPVAVTVKLWADPETDGSRACCSPEAVLSARGLAHSLGMAHFTLDLEESFRARVVDTFLDEWRSGRTPNPCIACNGSVRIGAMASLASRLGAGRLATGHYARILDDGEGPLVAEGTDPAKDQSYMLAALPEETVRHLEFPLGEVTKAEVRRIAGEADLPVARKPESQDLCFLAGTGKDAFLERHGGMGESPGPMVGPGGRRLGTHRGHHRYTVGQRRGLGVAVGEPLYVTALDAASNTVEVGPLEDLMADSVTISNVTLLRDGASVDRVRLRYRSDAVPASVDAPRGYHDRLVVRLGESFAGPAPGQTAVLMRGPTVIGHGSIE